ncbi:MAG: PmoA family protein [Opitutaceae bacterium]|nr:PmoA family protein [Opitutaceae bacterium]
MSSPETLQAEGDARRLVLRRRGSLHPLLVQHAPADRRAFIHPLAVPDGGGVLTEDEPPHHPWQHGLYVGLNDVNGTGFWTEGRLPGHGPDGTFHPEPMTPPRLTDHTAAWNVTSEWRAPEGGLLLVEHQAWRLSDLGGVLVLDLAWTLTARVDLRFGQHTYGGLFLRMPWRKETGGEVRTSEGAATIAAAEGRPARWVALAMPLPDRPAGPAGVAMLDHPANPGHPVPWRVDNNLGIAPSRCIAGAWTLAAGAATCSRYRLVAYAGGIDTERIERAWRDYAAEPV